MKVASILKTKGAHVVTVRPNETIQHAAAKLRLEGVGALIVSHDGVTLDGIIAERDITKVLPTTAPISRANTSGT